MICGIFNARDSPNPQSIAQACLDTLALHLPTKHTFAPLMELCNTFLSNPEAHARKAAVAALGVMSEGCAEPIKARLADILPKILQVIGGWVVGRMMCFLVVVIGLIICDWW